MTPAPVQFDALSCPACGERLDEDHDGTSCGGCGGLLVPRVFAERLHPMMGPASLPPVFEPEPRALACPGCRREMTPVLCHGVASHSCPRCRLLFFAGPRRRQLTDPQAPPPVMVKALARPTLLSLIVGGAREAPALMREALGVLVLAAVVLAALFFELRPH
jgi:hypothetical protein